MMYLCVFVGMWLGMGAWVCATKTLDWNDLKLGTVVVLDTMSIPSEFGFKRSRVRGTGSASLRIFRLSPNPRWRAFTVANIYPRRRQYGGTDLHHRCKKRIVRFLFRARFLTFFNVFFLFCQRFLFLKTFIENTIWNHFRNNGNK